MKWQQDLAQWANQISQAFATLQQQVVEQERKLASHENQLAAHVQAIMETQDLARQQNSVIGHFVKGASNPTETLERVPLGADPNHPKKIHTPEQAVPIEGVPLGAKGDGGPPKKIFFPTT